VADRFPPRLQRPALLKCLEAIGARPGALRRDQCGDWAIFGKHGHVYAVAPASFQFMFTAGRAQAWTYAKKALGFTRLTQEGDGEGALILDRVPTTGEGDIIRSKFGIAKRAVYSEETLAAKREWFSIVRQAQAQKPTLDDPGRCIASE
jgi:hypothetical protein